jgi:probable addiction module antidote protein
MPKRSRSHREAVLEHLKDPRASAGFLNAALEDSDEMFLLALRDVAEAFTMSKIAAKAGVSRESIYRMLQKDGNPTYASLTNILRALGLRIAVEADIMNRPPRRIEEPFIADISVKARASKARRRR